MSNTALKEELQNVFGRLLIEDVHGSGLNKAAVKITTRYRQNELNKSL